MYDAIRTPTPLNDAHQGVYRDQGPKPLSDAHRGADVESAALRIGNHPVGRGGFRLRVTASPPPKP